MTTPADGRARIEDYLLRLRVTLARMPESEKTEILSDIRNHLEERLTSGGESALGETITALGAPGTLAASYYRERKLASAAASSAPGALLAATFHWALTGLRGFLVFLVLIVGYSLGLGFIACALLKPFTPETIGLWWNPPSLNLGYQSPASGAHDLLGWWIIPVGYTVGPLFLIGTTRLIQRIIRRRKPS